MSSSGARWPCRAAVALTYTYRHRASTTCTPSSNWSSGTRRASTRYDVTGALGPAVSASVLHGRQRLVTLDVVALLAAEVLEAPPHLLERVAHADAGIVQAADLGVARDDEAAAGDAQLEAHVQQPAGVAVPVRQVDERPAAENGAAVLLEPFDAIADVAFDGVGMGKAVKRDLDGNRGHRTLLGSSSVSATGMPCSSVAPAARGAVHDRHRVREIHGRRGILLGARAGARAGSRGTRPVSARIARPCEWRAFCTLPGRRGHCAARIRRERHDRP